MVLINGLAHGLSKCILKTPHRQINNIKKLDFHYRGTLTIRSDCGPQFKSSQFQTFCQENGIHHIKTTPKWAQANWEVERQNASLMKRVQIAQAEGQDWKRELRKYVTVYRSIQHSTMGKSPAELLFQRKIRGKLPDIATPHSQVKSSHLYLYSAFNNTNCDKATAQYQNGKIVSIM